jgi:hypothetical protein
VSLDRLSSPRPARLRCNVCNLTDRASCGGIDRPNLPTVRLHLLRLLSRSGYKTETVHVYRGYSDFFVGY